MAATIVLTANETHHHRGAGPSMTPVIRSVIQLKFRLFSTSGTRDNGFSTDDEASPRITSGTVVVAPFMEEFRIRNFENLLSSAPPSPPRALWHSKIEDRKSKMPSRLLLRIKDTFVVLLVI
jgi:hypothetical protein